MSAALKLYQDDEKLSRKPHLGEKVAKLRLVWENPKLSAGTQKEKPEAKPGPSYGRVLYNYFRDYDPSTGRYIQSDPIGLAGGLNTYAYVLNDPINLIDPSGLVGLDRTGAYAYLKNIFRRDVEAAISDIPSVSATASATIGTTTMTRSTAYSGTNWGQTTQLSVGLSLGVCINEPKPDPNSCSSNRDIKPGNFSFGVGKNLGMTVGISGSACLNIGPSFGLSGGVGWDL